ncbi:MAG: AMP-binding protein [Pseudomonadota bacterium]
MISERATHLSDAMELPAGPLSWGPGDPEPDPARFSFTIDVIVRLATARAPGAPALWWRGDTISFANFDAAIDQCAAGLIEMFSKDAKASLDGQRIGVYVKKEPANIVLLFAVLRAGGIVVPLNPALKPEQHAYIAGNCDMTAAFMPQNQIDLLKSAHRVDALRWLGMAGADLQSAIETVDAGAWRNQCIECDRSPAEPAILFYTSGSTGHPKGVMVTHHANVLGAASVAHYLGISACDRVLTLLPLSFDYGFNQLVSTWAAGGCAVLHDFFLAADVPKVCERAGVTGIAAVPPLWHMLLGAGWNQAAIATLRFVTNSGGKLTPDIQGIMRAAFPQADIFAMYGLTEAFRSTYMPPDRLSEKPMSIGRAIPFARVAVAGPDGQVAVPGQAGELVHAGPLVAAGYWNDPDRTAYRFRPVPEGLRSALGAKEGDMCVFSGDQVFRDEDGDFHFVGRLDEMIKVLGNRLSPQEIEDVVLLAPGVDAAAAFGLEDAQVGAKILVVVQKGASAEDDAALDMAIRKTCRDHLPGYAQISHLLVLSALPRNPNGKIDRPRLKADAMALLANEASND